MSREDAPEAVGYKRPPQHSQFKKGQSGNPSGRRKGKARPNLIEELDKVLAGRITLSQNGQPKVMSRLAAVALKLVEGTLKNDVHARRDLFTLITNHRLRSDKPEEATTSEQDRAMIEAALARLMGNTGGHDA